MFVILAAGIVLLLWINRSLYQSPDSLAYAADIRDGGTQLFHPHHIGFTAILHGAYSFCVWTGIDADPIVLAQMHNLAWYAVALLAIAVLGTAEGWSSLSIAATMLLYAVAAVNLEYVTQVEVYIPAAAAGISVIALARLAAPYSVRRKLGLILLSFTAVIYHQSMLLMLPGLSLIMLKREGRRQIVVHGVIVAALLVLMYTAGYMHETRHGFEGNTFEYITGYLNHPSPEWGTLANMGTRGMKQLLASQASALADVSQPYHLFVGAVCLLLWLLIAAALFRRWKQTRHMDVFVVSMLSWLFAQQLLFLWWFPSEREFQIMTLPPLLMLFGWTVREFEGMLPDRSRVWVPGVIGMCLVLLLSTVNIPSVHVRKVNRGEWYDRAVRTGAQLGDADCLYTDHRTTAVLRQRLHRQNDRQIAVLRQLFAQGRTRDLQPFLRQPRSYAIAVSDITGAEVFNASADPAGSVQAYLRWLFEIRDANPAAITHRRYTMRRGGDGESWVVFSSESDTVRTMKDVFRGLHGLPEVPIL